MTCNFQSVDQFKADTLAIAKHLNTLKVGQLRQAVAKANGFNSVEAYTNTLSLGSFEKRVSPARGSGEITGIKKFRNKLIFTAEAMVWNLSGEPITDASDASDEEISEYLIGTDELLGVERFERNEVPYVSGYLNLSRNRLRKEPVAVAGITHFLAQFQGQCKSTQAGLQFVDFIIEQMINEKSPDYEWMNLLYQSVLGGHGSVLLQIGERQNDSIDQLMHDLLDAPAPLLFFHVHQFSREVIHLMNAEEEEGYMYDDPMCSFEEMAFADLMSKRVVGTLNVALQTLQSMRGVRDIDDKSLSLESSANEKLLREAMGLSFFLNKPVSFEKLFND